MQLSCVAELRNALARVSRETQHCLDRFVAEATFAEGLCKLHEREASAWRKLIGKACGQVSTAFGKGDAAALRRSVESAEKTLAPIAKAAKTYTIYCVGHAHIDMNWMWSWPETVATTNDTFRTVLRLMDDYPAFCFSQSQASVYEIAEKHNPEMLDEIRARVREGRWEVTASHWVEGDKNLVSGESLCRHLLYTRLYMKQLFGLAPEDVPIDWAPDTFGHAASVPAYLARGGVTRYYCCRSGNASSRPMAFRWRAPDGSEVLVCRETTWYNGDISPEITRPMLDFCAATGLRCWMNVYGVGDHGGGPTRRDLERALDMATWPVFPVLKLSTTRPFYEELERAADKLPVVEGELNFEFDGCYTSQSLIKRSVRFAENQLCDAEASAALAWAALGSEYPSSKLREAWQKTLFNHFHDILPGSGVHDTRTYTHGLFQEIAATSGMAETNALRAIAGRVDTSFAGASSSDAVPAELVRAALGAGVGFNAPTGQMSGAEQSQGQGPRPFVIFNTLAHERGGVVTVNVWDTPPAGAQPLSQTPFSVLTPSGNKVHAQRTGNGGFWGHDYVTLAFPVEPLSGPGYAAYAVVEGETAPGKALGTVARNLVVENDVTRAEIDTVTGLIRRLTHKASGVDVISPAHPAGAVEYRVERPHGANAWVLDKMGPKQLPEITGYGLKLNGPHVAAASFSLRIHESSFTLQYELFAGDPNLYLTLEGTWFERGTPQTGVPNLSITFPFALKNAAARYEIPFGAIDRTLHSGEEVPAIRWAAVTGLAGKRRAGCMLINDSKHGHSLDGNTLRLTLIRSTYEPDILPEIGQHRIRLALSPFAGELPVPDAIRLGATLNQPLRAVGTDVRKGGLPRTGQFLSVEPANIVFCALKKAENEDALVLRVFEAAGKAATARITVDEGLLGKVLSAAETDLLERPLADSKLKARRNVVSLPVPAHGIGTVLVRLQASEPKRRAALRSRRSG